MPRTRVLPARPPEKPVFLDRSGRRRRLSRLAGSSLAGLLIITIGALVAAVSGASSGGPPGLPDAGYEVDATPAPAPPAPPARTNPPPDAGTTSDETASNGTPATTPSPSDTKPGRGPNNPPPHPSRSR